ncbi:molybdopterin molybdotransferase MoeA [Permianibacter sp. IMCC34836]|uniref:molybdopterin molybdotransferase MoeA n=1 Tax=Permianibacter fluminis TaxID=2738515 RepID=UPI001552D9D2|nr:gephyrin-like molybdotransferase Glp [Permianibacter fluminis]NQD37249.1 molybdopterin molybdotransferase MoeA [Permianibacter fluminis]
MMSFAAAQALLRQAATPLTAESVGLTQVLGRIAAKAVLSRETIPPFANSAMDGFAVCSTDLREASASNAITLPVQGMTAAGQPPAVVANARGTAWRIMTGAPIPVGYDAILPIETVQLSADQSRISVNAAPASGQHVRAQGEDFALTEPVLAPGTRIGPAHIAALASTGIAEVSVVRQPRVVHFATGNELVADANQPLAAGQIRNSNSPFLSAVLAQQGMLSQFGGQLPDEASAVLRQLQQLCAGTPGDGVTPDIILTTGAVSAGDFDFIPQVVRELGGEVIFHKISIKPGKPILFARLPNGSLFFGLPGNPVSTAIGFRFFVLPLLQHMQGVPEPAPVWAALSGELHKPKADWRHFLKAQLSVDGDGLLRVRAHSGQESHKIKPLLNSDVWLVLDEGRCDFREGVRVPVASLFGDALPWRLS